MKVCEVCQKQYNEKRSDQRFCGDVCRRIHISAYKQRWYLDNVACRESLLPKRSNKGRWIHKTTGYVLIWVPQKGLVYEHRELAEKALGKPLPNGAVVHHMRGPADNHAPFDLIVCPNQEYHQLLHQRMGHRINQYG